MAKKKLAAHQADPAAPATSGRTGRAVKQAKATLAGLGIPLTLAPMEAVSVAALPTDPGWQFEPKWDGFRCLAFRAGHAVEIKAKSGKSLSRFFPDALDNLRALPNQHFVLDGELVVPVEGELSFDALQMRLHPAESRIRRLAAETPATFIAFDCLLGKSRHPLLQKTFEERRRTLEVLLARHHRGISLTQFTHDLSEAKDWLAQRRIALDGVIAKRLDLPYRPGERAMLKVKRLRTADCVVGGFRYASNSRLVGSLLLGLYDDEGLLHHVGFTSALSTTDKPALTSRLEKLIQPPGFTGDAPGGPSRWSTERSTQWQPLRPTLVAEVRYDHVTGDRFRHGTKFLRWRRDKSPRQCTFEQIGRASQRLGLG
jgi:ATP-dependent DNA ligase